MTTLQSAVPPASVVIVSRNRPQLLRETVDSILAATDTPAELVIIDQSDRPDPVLAQLVGGRSVLRYLPSASRGLSAGRNEGVLHARNDVLVFVDDDMQATDEWLRALVEPVASNDRTVATGRVTAGPAERPGAALPAAASSAEPAVYEGRVERDVLAGGNMAIRRDALARAGGWDERLGAGSRFPAAEDNDLGLRLLERGYRIAYVPKAEVVHRAWRSRAGGLAMRWRYGRGKGGFYVKQAQAGRTEMRGRLLRDVAKRARRFPRRLLQAPTLAASDLVYSLGVAAGAAHWLATEERRRGAPVERGSGRRAEVALTFDDGPSEWTEAVLDLLGERGARATFFVSGGDVDGREDVLRRIARAGHEIGNHLFTHRPASELTDDEIADELLRTRESVRKAAWADARLVRPPYAKQAARVAAVAKELGLGPTVLWSVDPKDFAERNADEIVNRVLAGLAPGAIVLLHDGIPAEQSGEPTREPTVGALPRLLEELDARGLRAVTVSELLR